MNATSPTRGTKSFLRRRVFTSDHKAVGALYLLLSLSSALLGVVLSLVMRFHLVNPGAKVGWFEVLWPVRAAGGVMTPELYLSLMTMHGTIMIFFVLTLAPQAGLGGYMLPLQLGAGSMAFPRLYALSFWVTAAALFVLLAAFFVPGGPPLSGWTAYPPLSAVGIGAGPGQGLGQTLWLASIGILCLGSLLAAVSFIATTLDRRAPGMWLTRMPLPCWAWFLTAVLILLAFPVLLAAVTLLLSDRLAGTSFFLPAGLMVSDKVLAAGGGSPLLWQHLFWFFGHPEVYIAILPAMGLVSQLLSDFSRRKLSGYGTIVLCLVAISFLGILIWGHHMFTSGISPYSTLAFSLLTMTIGVPSAVEAFHWFGTLWSGRIRLASPMLFALGFLSIFITGGLSGLVLGQPRLDIYFHDTYFVVAHFHLIMGTAALFGVFGGLYYWFPRMFGCMMNERLAKLHFYLTFAGAYAIFLPMHFLGFAGNPRRYADFTQFDFLQPLLPLHQAITWAAYFTAAAQCLFLVNLFVSMRSGVKAGPNPWRATTLEWAVDAPPETGQHGESVTVCRGPYEYGGGESEDFLMQCETGAGGLEMAGGEGQRARDDPSIRNAGWTGLMVLGAAAVMFYSALASAMVVRRGFGTDWQPTVVPRAAWIGLAGIVVSAVVLEAARRSARERSRRVHWLGLALAFASVVLVTSRGAGVVAAALQAPVLPASAVFSIAGAAYLLLALGGLIALIRLGAGRLYGSLDTRDMLVAYWHFVAGLGVCVALVFGAWS